MIRVHDPERRSLVETIAASRAAMTASEFRAANPYLREHHLRPAQADVDRAAQRLGVEDGKLSRSLAALIRLEL